ncbi:MAG: hypothetical protein U0M06_06285 [Clostridia bacterium]|nr:hypothetical protein [Clostridia bacterium]
MDINQNKNENLPDKLSMPARTLLLALSSALMFFCGLWNTIGIASDNLSILMLSGTLSLIVYVVTGGICALLVLDSPKLSPIPPIAAFITAAMISLAFGTDVETALTAALISIFPAVCGIIIAVSMKLGAHRSGTILAAAVGTGIFTLSVLAVSALISGKNFSGNDIMTFLDKARAPFIDYLHLRKDKLASLYGYHFNDLDIEGAVNSIFNILPALTVLVFSLEAFFSQLSLLALSRICNLYHKLEKKDTEFSVSIVTTVVFLLSYIIMVFVPSESNAVGAIAENITTILMLPLALVGFMSLLPKKEGNVIKIGCIPIVAVLFLLTFSTALAVIVLAFVGVYVTFKNMKSAEHRK